MAKFNINWDNSDLLTNDNNSVQILYYKRKNLVGAAWVPSADIDKTVNSTVSPILEENLIYQFKVEAICSENGPVINTNGVQECIGFGAIVPDLVNTNSTSAIGVDLTDMDITKVQFTLKKSSDNSTVFGPVVVNKSGNMASTVASNLTSGTQYYWQVILKTTLNGVEVSSSLPAYGGVPYGPYNFTTDAPPVQNLVWIADSKICETEGGFSVNKTISGVSSPSRAWYDQPNNRVYISDHDSAKGNVYWFNPDTATSEADMTYSNAIVDANLYNTFIDGEKKKIYFVGAYTGGLRVYDIATNTASVVPFGTDGAYSRIVLTVTDNYIYCNDNTNAIIVIDRNTLTVVNTKVISTITNSDHFTLDVQLVYGNGKLYAVNVNNNMIGTIGIYSPDLNTHFGEIALNGATGWSGGYSAYWQTGFYDKTSTHLYIGDIGSSKRYVIETDTNTVINEQVLVNKSGKTNVRSSWVNNPITGELLFLYAALNSSADGAPVKRTYLEDRSNYTFSRMFENQSYDTLAHIYGTNKLVGVTAGGLAWNGSAGYGSDGTIQILDSSNSGGIKTGKQIVLTLKQVDANNNNLPTGQTKNNTPNQPDYIAPSTDLTSCPIVYSTDCPQDLVASFENNILFWEFSLASAVKSNPNIAKIQVFAYNTNTASVEGVATEINAPFNSLYHKGQFNSLGGLNYSIKVKYLDASGIELQNC